MTGQPLRRGALLLALITTVFANPLSSSVRGEERPARRAPIIAYPTPNRVFPYPAPRSTVVAPSARVVPTARIVTAVPANRPIGTLGTFGPTPYMFTRGNGPAGGGYSPLGEFGDATMALYGPLSGLRYSSAPVLTYTRGYNGQGVLTPATSFSTPNLGGLSPVVYPTQATNYNGFRQSGQPPWWPSAINWIDQN